MTNLVSRAMAHLSSLLKEIQVKRFFAMALVGVLVFMTTPGMGRDMDRNSRAITNKVDQIVHQDDSDRPKTMREWEKEAERTEGAPVERVKEIGKESADAIQDFGELYPDVAKRSAETARDN